jgi:hypothetical protein
MLERSFRRDLRTLIFAKGMRRTIEHAQNTSGMLRP